MPQTPKKIKWYEHGGKNQNILQIYKRGMEFAFVSESNEQCHPFVFCKDFLQTVVFSKINEKPINVFSFSYNPEKNPISTKKLLLLVRNKSDPEFMMRISKSKMMINQIDTKLRMAKTRVASCEESTAMIIASPRWMVSPVMLSMFTLLLRVGMTHTVGSSASKTIRFLLSGKVKPYQSRDVMQLSEAMHGIKKIINEGDRRIFGKNISANYSGNDVVSIHRSGILSYSMLLYKNGDIKQAQF